MGASPAEVPPVISLSGDRRDQLAGALTVKQNNGVHLGYALPGGETISGLCVVVDTLDTMGTGSMAVCGWKKVHVYEVRAFPNPDGVGEAVTVHCAHLAELRIADSPVHWHGYTSEKYEIREGTGKMIIGKGEDEKIIDVKPGVEIVIPPGQHHGLVADDPVNGVRAMLTFTPGIATPDDQGMPFRDEQIVHKSAAARLKELTATAS